MFPLVFSTETWNKNSNSLSDAELDSIVVSFHVDFNRWIPNTLEDIINSPDRYPYFFFISDIPEPKEIKKSQLFSFVETIDIHQETKDTLLDMIEDL
jgi:hypothetical protein